MGTLRFLMLSITGTPPNQRSPVPAEARRYPRRVAVDRDARQLGRLRGRRTGAQMTPAQRPQVQAVKTSSTSRSSTGGGSSKPVSLSIGWKLLLAQKPVRECHGRGSTIARLWRSARQVPGQAGDYFNQQYRRPDGSVPTSDSQRGVGLGSRPESCSHHPAVAAAIATTNMSRHDVRYFVIGMEGR